ncbi:hypothetical protein [Streptomyces adelaidensis]|uniref:hypothetical protein n=1 Tax=Streptomyces adelaidensis TaxID=2796465 RepID=UPI001F15C41A|nr:hypothetical protein [Streptomyces adelaidensis]
MTDSRTERRSAGTEIMLDVLLRWTWIRRRTPAQDIADFDGGQPLRVVGFTKSIGGAVEVSVGKGKQSRGSGRATCGSPPVNRRSGKTREETGARPFRGRSG